MRRFRSSLLHRRHVASKAAQTVSGISVHELADGIGVQIVLSEGQLQLTFPAEGAEELGNALLNAAKALREKLKL